MTKRIFTLFLALTFGSLAFAQTALTSTTLSAAVSDSKDRIISVTSATGITAPSISDPTLSTSLYVDREEMFVTKVSGTSVTVIRGVDGTRAAPHASGATVYIAPSSGADSLLQMSKFGSCTAGNELHLPQIDVNIDDPQAGVIFDCFGSQWQINDNLPRYAFTLAPNAQRSAATAVAGVASSLTAQAGGATTTATAGTGGAGGALTLAGGAGGAGGSTSGTGGAGGAVSLIGGAGAGTITGGAGGAASLGGGAGANGTSAGGSGGNLNLYSGAVGTGGTGTDGTVNIRAGGAASTAEFTVSTAKQTTVASAGTNQNLVLTPSGTGNVTTAGGLLSSSSSGGVGYATGAGCAVTQLTSKSTGVTCTGSTGAITMNNASLGATSSVAFTVTDTSVAANDVIVVSLKSGNTANSYTVMVDAVAAGSFSISVRNYTAGALSEAIVLNFAVIKGATS